SGGSHIFVVLGRVGGSDLPRDQAHDVVRILVVITLPIFVADDVVGRCHHLAHVDAARVIHDALEGPNHGHGWSVRAGQAVGQARNTADLRLDRFGDRIIDRQDHDRVTTWTVTP